METCKINRNTITGKVIKWSLIPYNSHFYQFPLSQVVTQNYVVGWLDLLHLLNHETFLYNFLKNIFTSNFRKSLISTDS